MATMGLLIPPLPALVSVPIRPGDVCACVLVCVRVCVSFFFLAPLDLPSVRQCFMKAMAMWC